MLKKVLLNARTSDYMSIMILLIDKNTNINGRKLYSFLLVFGKHFTVIHPDLHVKIKELNINGTFCDIW